MNISSLHVENFKKFEAFDLTLHPQFTLLVGENGAGKTSILDALAVASGVWLVDAPDFTLWNSGRNIAPTEIRLAPEARGDRIQFAEMRPVIVRATGRIGDHDGVVWTRQIRKGGKSTTNVEAKQALQHVREIYARDREGAKVLCPVLAYYGAGRAWLPSNRRIPRGTKSNGPARRWAAFYDCFSERIRFPELQNWFLGETIAAGNRSGRMRPGFEVVKRAITRAVPDADGVWYDNDREQIVLSIAGHAQPFGNLSAGQRMMLALIADLAIKAVTQNAYLLPPDELGPENELPRVLQETPGVVLIDELDAHLHPIWQRRVVADLRGTFPSIQFVCTSHSPQVIGETPAESLRIFEPASGTWQIPNQSFGMDSNWILKVLMGGESADPEIEREVTAVREHAVRREFRQARELLSQLREKVGNSEEIQFAASTIDRVELLGK